MEKQVSPRYEDYQKQAYADYQKYFDSKSNEWISLWIEVAEIRLSRSASKSDRDDVTLGLYVAHWTLLKRWLRKPVLSGVG